MELTRRVIAANLLSMTRHPSSPSRKLDTALGGALLLSLVLLVPGAGRR